MPLFYGSQSLKDQGKSRTSVSSSFLRRKRSRNPLKIRASLGLSIPASFKITLRSQSLKDQGKSRTDHPRTIHVPIGGVAIP